MESIRSFFDSFREFIWDIIGYLLPGSYILILLSVCVKPEYFVSSAIGSSKDDYYSFTFIVISYLLGYVAYGFGWAKESILGKYSYVKQIEANVATRKAFSLTKQLLSNSLATKGVTDDLTSATVRDLRSIAMSYIPEHDQKIYTFTFRSDLSNQIGNISIMAGIFGILFSIFNLPSFSIFKTDYAHIVIYVCLVICYFFLRQTRNRFYAISIGLPFSIYTAKATQL